MGLGESHTPPVCSAYQQQLHLQNSDTFILFVMIFLCPLCTCAEDPVSQSGIRSCESFLKKTAAEPAQHRDTQRRRTHDTNQLFNEAERI